MRRLALIVATAALVLSGCYRPMADQMKAENPDMKPWWCNSTLMPGDMGSQWYLDHGYQKGELSWDDCLAVSSDFDEVMKFAMQWPTRGQAEAAGWTASANYAEGQGTHHALGSPLSSTFDPHRPTFLMFDGNTADAKLVGVAWFVYHPGGTPPDGFPGNNDWWHQHPILCMSSQTGLIIFDGPCPPGTAGNTVNLPDYWLLHAWIIPGWQHLSDVFVGHHPCLLASGPATPDDECWADAMHM